MYKNRLVALIGLAVFAQSTLANTIWLKDRSAPKPQVCKNALINNTANPEKIIGLGGVNRDGSSFTITIDNPPAPVGDPNPVTPATGDCQNLPKNTNVTIANPKGTPLVFNGGLTAKISPVHMWKEGTEKRMECLDQGGNFTGVTGSAAVGTVPNRYTIIFSYDFRDGCNMQSQQPSTTDGLPVFTRTAVITKQANSSATIFTGSYHLFDVNAVPEPSTILLLLTGLIGLVSVSWLRVFQRRSD
jgi:hypothetical protein